MYCRLWSLLSIKLFDNLNSCHTAINKCNTNIQCPNVQDSHLKQRQQGLCDKILFNPCNGQFAIKSNCITHSSHVHNSIPVVTVHVIKDAEKAENFSNQDVAGSRVAPHMSLTFIPIYNTTALVAAKFTLAGYLLYPQHLNLSSSTMCARVCVFDEVGS